MPTGPQCLDEATVVAFLDGELPREVRASVDAHLDLCPACLTLVANIGRATMGESERAPERYEIRDEIGAGGMGQVFEAYDTVLRRIVALKCVRAGPADAAAADRFEREMALTARLQHPSIIPVYDAGLFPDGSRYFAMRLVEGQPLGEVIDAASTLGERLEVLPSIRRACEAVAYAHTRGVLHRDLKPANILIGPFGETVVLDWGLGKALDDSVEEDEAEFTHMDAMDARQAEGMTLPGAVMGTAGFIAPEVSRGEPARPCSDVFSLGKILEKLLHGDDGSFEGHREVLEDLRAIVVRATADDLQDRYANGSQLCADLRRFEAGQTVSARDYSVRTRMRRFVGRHRRPITLSSGFVGVGAIVGAGAATLMSTEGTPPCSGAQEALAGIWDEPARSSVRDAVTGVGKAYAQDALARTERALDVYADDWVQLHEAACRATARGEQSSTLLDLRMACLDRAATELRAVVEVLADADADVVQKADGLLGALPDLRRCSDRESLESETEPPSLDDRGVVDAVREHLARTNALRAAGRYDQALRALEHAQETAATVQYEPLRTELALARGRLHEGRDELDAAESALATTIRLGTRGRQWDAVRRALLSTMMVVGGAQLKTAEALRYREFAEGLSSGTPADEASFRHALAVVLASAGRFDEAESELRATIALRETSDDPLDVALAQFMLGQVLTQVQRFEDAEELLRQAGRGLASLGKAHPRVAHLKIALSEALREQGKYAEAEREARDGLALLLAALDPQHGAVAEAHSMLGTALAVQGKEGEAEREFETVIEIFEATRAPDDPMVALSHTALGSLRLQQRALPEAEAEFRTALRGGEASLGSDHPSIVAARQGLAATLTDQGKFAEAEAEFRDLLALFVSTGPADDPMVGWGRSDLATNLMLQGKLTDAETELRAALEILHSAWGAEHPAVVNVEAMLAEVLLQTGRAAVALPHAERAWVHRQRDAVLPPERADTAFLLARILWIVDPEQRTRARELAEDARSTLHEAGGETREIETWLAEH